MDTKNVALSMIINGDLFWIHIGRALQVATPEQVQAIRKAWPEEYGRFEQSANRLGYQYKLASQFQLVVRRIEEGDKKPTRKVVLQKADEMEFNKLAQELEKSRNYTLLLDLSRRFGLTRKTTEELVDTAVT